jgi:hypothetical protein
MKSIFKYLTSCAVGVITLAGAFLLVAQSGLGQEEEMEFTNLQMLPPDIGEERLFDIMTLWEAELGVDCEHCHVAYGRGDPRNDFASDAKQPKVVTRLMLENLITFNRTLTTEALDKPEDEITRINCATCHQGNAIPPEFELPEEE